MEDGLSPADLTDGFREDGLRERERKSIYKCLLVSCRKAILNQVLYGEFIKSYCLGDFLSNSALGEIIGIIPPFAEGAPNLLPP